MDVLETIRGDRVVAVVRAARVADSAALAKALSEGGVRCVEFTFTISGVLDAIEAAAASGALVGAGTVTEPGQARDAISAGARFVVSPALAPEIVPPCREAGVPAFLAAFTPTEVLAAVRAGTAAVKLFPAGVGGPQYLKDLSGPMPDVPFMPSGGVDETNARDFLAAGAIAVFAGSGLVPGDLAAAGDHEEIRGRAETFVASLG
ncbi:MAG: bifunctional 4-hydroxy-2-oxoglutarate aldolase/2-dehydro-3-deoxy-phosphogluconate aldolase [Actinomycetota bacterium]